MGNNKNVEQRKYKGKIIIEEVVYLSGGVAYVVREKITNRFSDIRDTTEWIEHMYLNKQDAIAFADKLFKEYASKQIVSRTTILE